MMVVEEAAERWWMWRTRRTVLRVKIVAARRRAKGRARRGRVVGVGGCGGGDGGVVVLGFLGGVGGVLGVVGEFVGGVGGRGGVGRGVWVLHGDEVDRRG